MSNRHGCLMLFDVVCIQDILKMSQPTRKENEKGVSQCPQLVDLDHLKITRAAKTQDFGRSRAVRPSKHGT